MSHAQHGMPAERDDDAAERVARATTAAQLLVLKALASVTLRPYSLRFRRAKAPCCRGEAKTPYRLGDRADVLSLRNKIEARRPLTPAEDTLIATLAWRYRRQLPRHLAPRLNPDDPIVRALNDPIVKALDYASA